MEYNNDFHLFYNKWLKSYISLLSSNNEIPSTDFYNLYSDDTNDNKKDFKKIIKKQVNIIEICVRYMILDNYPVEKINKFLSFQKLYSDTTPHDNLPKYEINFWIPNNPLCSLIIYENDYHIFDYCDLWNEIFYRRVLFRLLNTDIWTTKQIDTLISDIKYDFEMNGEEIDINIEDSNNNDLYLEFID